MPPPLAMSWRESRTVAVVLVTLATFTDILAYSIAVPVLPDLGLRLGASPTVVGLLFASFGLTVLVVSVPMGAVSDRIGRIRPLALGMTGLAASTVLFAFAPRMSWLFAARLAQGAADAVTWVVGFALVADLYPPDERGRVMGLVMSGTTFGFMMGPTLGGWLYEAGGARLPYLVVAVMAFLLALGFLGLRPAFAVAARETVPLGAVLRSRAVAVCALAVVVGGGTIAMAEPVYAMFLASAMGLGPARIGLVFGGGAVIAAVLHPVMGRIADRFGGRTLTLWGLASVGAVLPLLATVRGFPSAVGVYAITAVAMTVLITPSLTYMAEATTQAGVKSFGAAYGLYNFAWALGLLVGPSLGGFLYERIGFVQLSLTWAPFVVLVSLLLAWVGGGATRSSAAGVPPDA